MDELCTHCHLPIRQEASRGTGNGFAHNDCFWRAEAENLLWNLAGCETYAMGADLDIHHNKEMARPALESVRRLALEHRALKAEFRSRLKAEMEAFSDRVAKSLELSSDAIRLMSGEMTASEMRTVKAVLQNRAAVVRGLPVGGEEK